MPIKVEKLDVVDSVTGEPIQEFLVVPRYTIGPAINLGDEQNRPDERLSLVAIGRPFVYRPGEELRLYQGDSAGFFEAWLGGGAGWLDGVAVIAPGYESKWISNLWPDPERDRWYSSEDDWKMTPLPAQEAKHELEHVRKLLLSPTIEGVDRRRWSLGGDEPIQVAFTDEERRLALEFLDTALATLNEDPARQ